MTLNNIVSILIIGCTSLFGATETDIGIYIVIDGLPTEQILEALQVNIRSFFTPNHHFYPLTPSQKKRSLVQTGVFSVKEAFAILDVNSALFNNVPRGQLLSVHLTVGNQVTLEDLYFSLTEKDVKKFTLQSLDKNAKDIPIRVFLIDLNKPACSFPVTEVTFGEKYPIERVRGKTVFIYIPNIKGASFSTINFNDFTLPLEVKYHGT